jgi:MoaA/NifB/PqqE/SkfB family radical SAM enzyme
MKVSERIRRHLRITRQNYERLPSPPFLVLFINSICNMKCEHCFYWRSLNAKDDLTGDELVRLSRSLGRVENLNLSGGEPFIRKDFAEICGSFTDWTTQKIAATLQEPELELFAVELSLDGMPKFHDEFRVAKNSFRRAMETYDALVELQREDPRLRIHAISTATDVNMEEIRELTSYLYERCPAMDHHNLAIIRGDRKNPSLQGPALEQYAELYDYMRKLWAPRERGRYGATVEPMLQWAKIRTIEEEDQFVPCLAGRLSVVVYANGDVSLCEIHEPLGNLREKTFSEIWGSVEAADLRQRIRDKECHCTTEVFMWSSIVHQPVQLARAALGAKVWKRPKPMPADERPRPDLDESLMPVEGPSAVE